MAIANPDKVQQLEKTLGSKRNMSALASVLQGRVPVETFLRLAVQSAQRNPRLLACEPASIINGLLMGASLGLDFADGKGHAYLVPFKNNRTNKIEATFICGYQGYIELATRSGRVSTIIARAVYKQDDFVYNLATNEITNHMINGAHDDPTDITHFYAVAKFPDGNQLLEVMTREEVDAIRARSRAGNSGPWVTDYPMMGRKTSVRRLSHYLPKTDELAKAIVIEDRAEQGDMDITDLLPEIPVESAAEDAQPASAIPPEAETPETPETNDAPEAPSQPAAVPAGAKAGAKSSSKAASGKSDPKRQIVEPDLVKAILDGCKTQQGIMEVVDTWKSRLTEKQYDDIVKYAGNLAGDLPVE